MTTSVTLRFLEARSRHDRALIDLLETALDEIATAQDIDLAAAREMAWSAKGRATAFRDANNACALRPKWEEMNELAEKITDAAQAERERKWGRS